MTRQSSQMTKASSAADWLVGGGELGDLVRSLDWSNTPVGSVESWPQSLRTAASICLNSRFPTVIYWGAEFAMLYNDEYAQILGTKHPWAMGKPVREVWSEIWHINGPMLNQVLSSGIASWSEDKLLNLHRRGYLEECYFTYSFTPVLVEAGIPGGIFCDCQETTARVIAERRMRMLRELSDTGSRMKTVEVACKTACQVLSRNSADVTFALLYLLESDKNSATLAGTAGLQPGHENAPAMHSIENDDASGHIFWPFASVAHSGKKEAVQLPANAEGSPWPESAHTAVVLPISRTGERRPYGLLVAGISPRLALDDDYSTFLDLVAGQIATSLSNVLAYEEERKRAEKLAELDRAKTTFFSNVSHEFRTPLMLMLGPLEEALAEEGIPTAQRQRLEIAHRNSMRLLKLVNILLDFSRIEAGRIQATYKPLDLALYTADLASVFRSAIEKAGMELVVECPPLPEPVFVDRDMWEKIVLNLLSNAFKFTEQGRIRVSQAVVGDSVELAVEDTGCGIPADQLDNVFKRFHRIEGVRGRTHEGTGIGLALVQELAKLHGGMVRVESSERKGSIFTVRIPLGKQHLPVDCITAESTSAATGTRKKAYLEEALHWLPDVGQMLEQDMDNSGSPVIAEAGLKRRLLLADDNADMREYVRRILAAHYDVDVAPDGEAALAMVKERKPDLVLSDIMMPGLDGFGLLAALRADPETSAVPVIFLSARAGEESRVEGLEAGADDYLVKPFSSRELLARVRSNLELAEMRSEVARREQEALDAAGLFEAVRKSEEQFRTLADSIPNLSWWANGDGYITWYNRRWYEYTGTTPEQMEGWGWQSVHDSKVLTKVLERWKASIATGEPFEMEFPLRGADGVYRPFLTRVLPLKDSTGMVIRWFGTNTDISALKQAEEALRESEKRLRLIIDGARDYAIFMVDIDGRVISWNEGAKRLKGWNAQEILGRHFSLFYTEEAAAAGQPERELEIAAAEGRYEEEGWRLRKDGSKFLANVIITAIRDESGKLRGFSKITRDITERKQAEQALRKAHDELAKMVEERTRELSEKEVLLKEVHHRVKNNLQVISSLVGLQADRSTDETVREVLRDVTYRVRSMALVHEKLYQSADLARIDFAEYVRSLLSYLWRAHGAAAANVRMMLDLSPVLLPVDTAVPCGLILNELAGNALKHAFRGRSEGEVTISLQSLAEGRVRLGVHDNGVGLPDGFDWRQPPSLGLRLVQMLSCQLDADVEVSGKEGTRFEITFGI